MASAEANEALKDALNTEETSHPEPPPTKVPKVPKPKKEKKEKKKKAKAEEHEKSESLGRDEEEYKRKKRDRGSVTTEEDPEECADDLRDFIVEDGEEMDEEEYDEEMSVYSTGSRDQLALSHIYFQLSKVRFLIKRWQDSRESASS